MSFDDLYKFSGEYVVILYGKPFLLRISVRLRTSLY